MYLPFASLCRQHDIHAIYWREMLNDGSNDYLMNDAYGAPQDELMFPKLACHYPLTSTTATDIVQGGSNQGSYSVAGGIVPDLSSGPAVAVSNLYGRGGGIANPTVMTSTTSKVASMTGPTPSASTPNPVGISGSFSLACWFRITDTATSFNPSGDAGGRTSITLVGIQNHDVSYAPKGFHARIVLQRRKESGADVIPGYWLRGEIGDDVSIPDSGAAESSAETDPTATPYDAAVQNTLWHYAVMTVKPSASPGAGTLALYLDGVLIQSRSYSGVLFPSTPQFRLSVNSTIGASTDYSIRDGQIAYVSAYNSLVSEADARRHFNSMRRPLDMKVNHNSYTCYSTEPMTSVGSLTETDLTYCPSAQRAEHRHDNRWVNMIRLNNPLYDKSQPSMDNHIEDSHIGIPRHWELVSNSGGTDPADGDQKHRFNTHVATGGYRINLSGSTKIGNGPTVIAGWDGINTPRNSAYPTGGDPGRDHTVIVDFKGRGNRAGAVNQMNWSYSDGTSTSMEDQTETEGIDGQDGFALSRLGDTSSATANKFEYYTPWETSSDAKTQTIYSSDSTGASNRYQAIGCSGARTGLTFQVVNPSRHTSDNWSDNREAAGYENQDSPASDVYRMSRHQAAQVPRILYCNRYDNGTDLDVPSNGNDHCVDQNRYGPIAVFGESLDDHEVTRLLRVMHGQPLIRTRPGLRSPLRHFQFTAPSRSMT
tara:strand:+ start:1820 stop:3943 length:2124 start_codon:yes stop_codon:yes gene_type:complete